MVTSDQTTEYKLQLVDVHHALGHLHRKRFQFRSEESLQATSMSEVDPHTGLSEECKEDLNAAIHNYEESFRLFCVCNYQIPWDSRGNLTICYDS